MTAHTTSDRTAIVAKMLMICWAIFLLCTDFGLDGWYTLHRFVTLGVFNHEPPWSVGHDRKAVFFIVHLTALFILWILPLARSRWRYPVLLILFLCTAIDYAYFSVSAKYPSLNDIQVLYISIGNTSDAVAEYWPSILRGIALAALCFAPAAYLSMRDNVRRYSIALPLTGMLAVTLGYSAIALAKGEQGLIAFPRGFNYLSGSLTIGADSLRKIGSTNKVLALEYHADLKIPSSIVFIIDESVRADAIDTAALTRAGFLNLGPGWSAANCSAPSNYYLRRSVLVNQLPTEIPSIFELAKQAGFNTVYIDNQYVLRDTGTRNYFNATELQKIDKTISPPREMKRYQVDLNSITSIQAALKQNKQTFILINKSGAHFPYEMAVSPAARSDNRLMNYRAAVKQNTDEFLTRLVSDLPPDTVVVYTSDHGQNFGPGHSHCNAGDDVSPQEWSVPILIWSGNVQVRATVKALSEQSHRPLSHFDLINLVHTMLGWSLPNTSNNVLADQGQQYCAYYGAPTALFGKHPQCRIINAAMLKDDTQSVN